MGKHKDGIDRGTKSSPEEFPLYCSNCRRVCWFTTPHEDELEGGLTVKSCWECDMKVKYKQPDFDIPADTVMLDENMSPIKKGELEDEPAPLSTSNDDDDSGSIGFSFNE